MKKSLFLVAAIAMMVNAAQASKARVTALASTPAITDTQSIFSNAADLNYVGDFATFEMGETANTTALAADSNAKAEGGFLQSTGDSRWGFYLGRLNSSVNQTRSAAATYASAKFLTQENPLDVYYGSKSGDLSWGLDFNFSNSDKKTTTLTSTGKQSTMGIGLGVKTDIWGAYANVGLGSTAQDIDGAKYTGKQGLILGAHYYFGTIKTYLKEEMFAANATNAAGDTKFDYAKTITTIGMTNKWKQDASLFFYGIAYKLSNEDTSKITGSKVETNEMPVHIGMEVDAASWLTLRGSVQQNILLGSKKSTASSSASALTDTIAENTTTAAGAGIKFGKNLIDFVMTAGTSGAVNFDNLGASAAYTYNF